MKVIDGVAVWGDPVDEGALKQAINSQYKAESVALMADHHKGYTVPIGGVVAYKDKVSPSGVGYDIGCGNKAVRLDINIGNPPDFAKEGGINIPFTMDVIWSQLSFGIGRKNNERVDHDLFDDDAWQIPVVASLRDRAAEQLGTIGSGNHYVDILVDEEGWIWVGVHFGSRGFGHGIANYYLKAGGADERNMDALPLVLDVGSPMGDEYIAAMRLAGRYAYAGRDWVCARVASLLATRITDEVHNHHNFAWQEEHEGKMLWVVRKGATPAFPGQRGFVGGSMGDNAVIIEGIKTYDEFQSFIPEAYDEQRASFFSTVHGAGRVMSRTDATGRNRRGKQIRPPRITREAMDEWINDRGVVLRGAAEDEAPQAYKRLPEVLKHHTATIKVLHTLRPLGVAMAGTHEIDPYKD